MFRLSLESIRTKVANWSVDITVLPLRVFLLSSVSEPPLSSVPLECPQSLSSLSFQSLQCLNDLYYHNQIKNKIIHPVNKSQIADANFSIVPSSVSLSESSRKSAKLVVNLGVALSFPLVCCGLMKDIPPSEDVSSSPLLLLERPAPLEGLLRCCCEQFSFTGVALDWKIFTKHSQGR